MNGSNLKEKFGKSIELSADEDQIDVVIAPPRDSEEKRKYVDNIQFKQDKNDLDSIGLYVSINKNYLQNLISGNQSIKEFGGQSLGRMIYKKQLDDMYFAYSFSISDVQRSIAIFEINIARKRTEKAWVHTSWKLNYKDFGFWKNDISTGVEEQKDNSIRLQWKKEDILKYIQNSDIFLEVNITYKNSDTTERINVPQFCGLKNVGNTCYMNSFLQSLYYIMYLRKQIVEKQLNQDQFFTALQQVFGNLMKNNGKTVDPSSIVKTRSWSRGFQFEQQDIHQFKMQFFNQLEKFSPKILQVFQGQMLSTVFCKDVQYFSKTKIVFDEIELNLTNNKGKAITNIRDSLQYITQEECLQTDIQTETHGLHLGYKKVSFVKLPPIIFFNLKRYQYNEFGLHKLLSKFQYQPEIDLSFAIGSEVPQKYILYSVLVHKGKSPIEGHYYSYINVSTNVKTKQWYKFNDSYVYKVDEKEVIEDNFGGFDNNFKFDRSTQAFLESHQNNITTAYILIYIQKTAFQQIQNVKIDMPQQLKASLSQQEEQKDSKDIKAFVLTLDTLIQKNIYLFDISSVKQLGKSVILSPKTPMHESIQKITKVWKNGTVQYSVWKIASDKTVFNLRKQYNGRTLSTLYTLLGDNKMKSSSDYYILLIPNTNKWSDDNFRVKNQQNKLCLIFNYLTYLNQKQQFVCEVQGIELIESSQSSRLSQVLQSQVYDNNYIFQKNKRIIDLRDLNLTNKLMYCEVARSYMAINEDFFIKARMELE